MAFGLASVASPQGGGGEALRAPEAGLVAETRAEWEHALRRLISDAELRERMGQRAFALAHGQGALSERSASLARCLRLASQLGQLRKQRA